MNNNPNNIMSTQNALGAVASWISQEEKIKITWNNGTECCADMEKKVLSIPRISESDMLDGDALWIVRSHIYHEAGHLAESIMDKRVDNAGLHLVVNALEDRRMEHVIASRYAGCAIAFKKALAHYSAKLKEHFEQEHGLPEMEAIMALSFEVEGQNPEWTLSPEAVEIHDLIKDDFFKVFGCRNAKEAVDLGIQIWNKIKKNDEDKQQQQQSQNGEQGDQSQEGDEQSEGDGKSGEQNEQDGGEQGQSSQSQDGEGEKSEQSEGNGEQSGKSASSEGEDENGEQSGKSSQSQEGDEQSEGEGKSGEQGQSQDGDGEQSEQSEQSEGNGEQSGKSGKSSQSGEQNEQDGEAEGEKSEQGGKSEPKSLEERMAEAMNKLSRDAIEGEAFKKILDENKLTGGTEPYTSYRGGDTHRVVEPTDSFREAYKAELESCTGEAALLARTLEQYLKTITRTKMLHCQRRGKLDPRRFAVMAKGLSKEVFKHLSTHQELDTAIQIVFDESGSMSNEYAEVRRAIIIIAEALNRVGIPFEITGGTTSGTYNYPSGFTRANPIEYHHYKCYGDNWDTVRSSLEGSYYYRNYIDGEMIEFAARRLVERPEKRKIIFSLSDGCPCGGEGYEKDYLLGAKLKEVCADCRKHGIEVYSFGINTDEPAKFYGKAYSVNLKPEEIGVNLSRGITNVMTRGAIAGD